MAGNRVRGDRKEKARAVPAGEGHGRAALFFVVGILTIAVLVVFAQVGGHDFVNFDDNLYVTGNHRIQQGLSLDTIRWAFRSSEASNWHPVTWVSHALDVQLFGLNPGPHHLVNVLFHGMNTILLFALLLSATGALWRSAVVAALFAVHPLHVESVAWVAERKDVLSTFFWLLSTWCYLRYVKTRDRWHYGLALLCFTLGLMTKPMLVTLPFTLLLLDFWPLGRFRDNEGGGAVSLGDFFRKPRHLILLEKIPFLVPAAISCVITLWVQRGAMAVTFHTPFRDRLANVLLSYVKYLGLTFWPRDLAVFYPLHRGAPLSLAASLGALIVLVGISAFALKGAWKRGYFLVGWFYYLGTLVPVIGFIHVGNQALADRYTYVPLTGLFVIVVWGAADLMERRRGGSRAALALAAGSLIVLSTLAWNQVRHWRNSGTLFTHAARVTRDNWVAHLNLGLYYLDEGKLDQAILSLEGALKVVPAYPEAHLNLAEAFVRQGQFGKAVDHYLQALKKRPGSPETWFCLGNVYQGLGEDDRSIRAYRQTIRLNPDHAKAYNNIGISLCRKGLFGEAVASYTQAIRKNPDAANYHKNIGAAYAALGRHEDALGAYFRALEIEPDTPDMYFNLGNSYSASGRLDEAIAAYENALRTAPEPANILNNLGLALLKKDRYDQAAESFERAFKADPTLWRAAFNLGIVQASRGRPEQAVESFRSVLRLKGGHTMARYQLGIALLESGRKGQALEEYRLLEANDPALAKKLRAAASEY